MASAYDIFPRVFLAEPRSGYHPLTERLPETKFLFNQRSIPCTNASISRNLPRTSSLTTPISVGHSSERGFSTAVCSSRVDRAVSGTEEASPAVSEGGFAGQNEEGTGGDLVGCKTCGRSEIERGCNGEGRIQGGIGTIPGFTWWPIKAYRPCPGLIACGGRYKRRGQSMDEVAFGRKGKDDDIDIKERLKRR